MSSSSKADLEGVGFNSDDPGGNAAEHVGGPYEDRDGEQDEDGDVDFNPFLGEPLSPEATSSLSSEIECVDLHVFGNDENSIESTDIVSTKINDDGVQGFAMEDSEYGEDEFLMESSSFPGGMYETAEEEDNGESSETDVNDEDATRKLSSAMNDNNSLMDIDDEDAICKRTRARYSLASFTLDELETFLQETDDEDDIRNVDVDEEEEYRKFLASVLLGGDSDSHADQENVIVDDDDDDNDADFLIEIEEALESNLDENIDDNAANHQCEETSRRPETRQTKRQKKYENEQKKLVQQINRPLRPSVPGMPNAPLIRFHASECLTLSADYGFINGFTPHQIGQLHNLIYEHVQLLIQVFSLCVLDPARQHIASQLQGLISDMLSKRDQALAPRKVAYPANCFSRPFVHPMVPAELPRGSPTQSISESVTPDAQRDPSSLAQPPLQNISSESITPDAQRYPSSLAQPPLQNISSSDIRNKYDNSKQYGYSQTIDGSSWMPFIGGPLLSILDVAPLHLVARYMDDVKIAVQDYRKRLLEDTRDPSVDAVPMFPLHGFPPSASCTAESPIRNSTRTADTLPSSSPIQQPRKKTMAAALVESSMKQSVALVPKVIVKLSERFFQLFNPALFPRKPPPASVANRVLFTDAEDELLAMGLMEYNTDWKAIQQRFLPCKSKHQIFVRQKNRSSGKAPENPIKAVKRMKNSPLTEDELARIEEGLRIYKLDWVSLWKLMVPHRDPSLLPRQWRTAIGTQRSYKTDPEKREKRRLHGLKRKQSRANLTNTKDLPEGEDDGSENPGENGEDSTCNGDETYVHKVFLADWRPDTSSSPAREGTYTREQLSENNTVKELPRAPINSWHPNASSNFTQAGSPGNILGKPNPLIPGPSRPPVYMRPYRARRTYNQQCVKLAPELPPVTLPSSARIISKSALKNIRCEPSASISGGGIGTQNGVKKHTNNSNPVTVHRTNAQEHNITPSLPEETSVIRNDTESDLHMHPLLFKAPNEGHLPYYPLKSGINSSSSFSFCTKNQPELNLLHNPHQADATANYFKDYGKSTEDNPSPFGFDFHPLLQIGACSNALREEKYDTDQREIPFNGNPSATSTKRYSLNDASSGNELDLDIHLSVASRMDNMSSADVANQHYPTRSPVRIPKEVAQINRTLKATTPSNNISGCRIDNVGDQSLQEIVMEHEELSDSEEEIDGHVQFECEEMADSEGEEGSACEQSVNTHNKGTRNNLEEKVSSAVANGDKLQNYAERNSTWLSLNSFVPGPS